MDCMYSRPSAKRRTAEVATEHKVELAEESGQARQEREYRARQEAEQQAPHQSITLLRQILEEVLALRSKNHRVENKIEALRNETRQLQSAVSQQTLNLSKTPSGILHTSDTFNMCGYPEKRCRLKHCVADERKRGRRNCSTVRKTFQALSGFRRTGANDNPAGEDGDPQLSFTASNYKTKGGNMTETDLSASHTSSEANLHRPPIHFHTGHFITDSRSKSLLDHGNIGMSTSDSHPNAEAGHIWIQSLCFQHKPDTTPPLPEHEGTETTGCSYWRAHPLFLGTAYPEACSPTVSDYSSSTLKGTSSSPLVPPLALGMQQLPPVSVDSFNVDNFEESPSSSRLGAT